MRTRLAGFGREERGFTLPEVLITIVILGILFAIASSTWQNVVESRNVDSATNQLGSDLRLANSRATNQLAEWRVVLVPGRGDESVGPDYYLVKMKPDGTVDSSATQQRTLPGSAKITSVAGLEDTGLGPLYSPLVGASQTRTLKFNSDGSMSGVTVDAGYNTIEITIDGNPARTVTFNDATSRIKID